MDCQRLPIEFFGFGKVHQFIDNLAEAPAADLVLFESLVRSGLKVHGSVAHRGEIGAVANIGIQSRANKPRAR